MEIQAQVLAIWKKIKNGYKICALILLAMLIILSLYSCSKTEIKPSAQQLMQISDIIRQKFNTKPDFWKLNTQWLITNDVLPKEWIDEDKVINNLGKEVVVGSGINGLLLMPGAKSFDVVYKDLNYNECVELSSYQFQDKQILGLLAIKIINGEEEKRLDWGENGGLPLSKPNAEKICNKKNMIIWSFE